MYWSLAINYGTWTAVDVGGQRSPLEIPGSFRLSRLEQLTPRLDLRVF